MDHLHAVASRVTAVETARAIPVVAWRGCNGHSLRAQEPEPYIDVPGFAQDDAGMVQVAGGGSPMQGNAINPARVGAGSCIRA